VIKCKKPTGLFARSKKPEGELHALHKADVAAVDCSKEDDDIREEECFNAVYIQ